MIVILLRAQLHSLLRHRSMHSESVFLISQVLALSSSPVVSARLMRVGICWPYPESFGASLVLTLPSLAGV